MTRFSMSTVARSGSRLRSNVAVTVLTPSLVLEEVMYFMPSAPLICCSSGVVTADFDGLGTGSGIDGGNADLRRREIGKLCDGQRGNAGGARQNNQQGADGGEDRAMNEKVDHKSSLIVSGIG